LGRLVQTTSKLAERTNSIATIGLNDRLAERVATPSISRITAPERCPICGSCRPFEVRIDVHWVSGLGMALGEPAPHGELVAHKL
jgi:hypothetical protein